MVKHMLKRELVAQAVAHQNSGRVPYCIHLVPEAYELYGDQLLKDYPNKEVQDDLKAGLINKEQAICLSIGNHMLNVGTAWWEWDYGHTDPAYQDPYDVPAMMPPILLVGDNEKIFVQAKYIREKYGVYIISLIFANHWEKAYFIRGLENFLADIAGAPEFAAELLQYITDNNMECLRKTVACPDYDAILLGSDWGTQRDLIMSVKSWRELIRPGQQVQFDLIRSAGKKVMVHSCGDIVKILDDLTEMGVDILNPVQPECMDLAFLKENYGDKLTFWGGISTQDTLPYGTPEDVRRETERVIRLMSEGGGYITCSSQEIQTDVPYENLKALIDTAKAFA